MICTRLCARLLSTREKAGTLMVGSRLLRFWLAGLLVLGIFPVNPVYAEPALVRLDVPQQPSFTAGERVPIVIELLVKGQFAGPTYIDIPEVEGAIIMQVSQRPVPGTRRLVGETYASLSFDFALYPQQGTTLKVLPFTARFGSRERYDQPVVAHKLNTESFVLTVHAPAGALRGELILSATSVHLTQTWSPEPIAARVGDAFTRTITVSADGVAAMLLPQADFSGVEGLASYTGTPQVTDQTERGVFRGTRIDTLTYVCEREGVFEFPELSIRWWNPANEVWQTRTLPVVRLEVAANPGLKPGPAEGGEIAALPVVSVVWIQWLTGALVLVALLVMLTPRLLRRWRQWAELRSLSEAGHWARLIKACRSADPVAVYTSLNQWLALFGQASTDLTLRKVEGVSDRLAAECIGLQLSLVGLDYPWDTGTFCAELAIYRQSIQRRAQAEQRGLLPPLNPLQSCA